MKFFLSLSISLFLVAYVSYTQPKFAIEGGDTVNWGVVNQTEEPLKAKVKLLNLSKTDTLIIYNVKPSCGCTTAPLSNDKIPPLGHAFLDVQLNTSGFQGEIVKKIDLSTNDPNNRRPIIYLKATLFQPISYFPRFVNFPNSRLNQLDSAKLILKNNTNTDIRLEKFIVQPEEFKVNIKDGTVLKKNTELTLVVTFTPVEYGRFGGNIKIKTNSEDIPTLNIPIHGFARDKE